MTTQRVEEKYEEYRKKFLLATGPETEHGMQLYCSRCSGSEEFHTFFTEALTEAHQAGIDEAVEKIKKLEKYKGIVTHDDKYLNGKVEGYNQALDDTIKALQDNK